MGLFGGTQVKTNMEFSAECHSVDYSGDNKVLTELQIAIGGRLASWLVRLTRERVVRVRALARDILLCSWARHSSLTVPLSTQVYKWDRRIVGET